MNALLKKVIGEGGLQRLSSPQAAARDRELIRLFLEQVHERFVLERMSGYTDPRNGVISDPISREEAEARWEAAAPKFREAVKGPHPKLGMYGTGSELGYTHPEAQ